MADFLADLVVVGGGPAGVTAALRARELGATVTLVERAEALGGTCTNDGCVPTRALARAARLVRDADQFADYGLRGEPPVVDLAALMERTRAIVGKVHAKKDLRTHLEWSGVTVRAGTARFTDATTLALDGGGTVRGKQFVLCVGGHARRLGFPGAELTRAHSDVWEMNRLPEALTVVGGSATGCQIASVFAAFGSRVTVLEAAPRLLGGEDEDVAEAIGAAFAARGIEVVTGIAGIDRVERAGGRLGLAYRTGDSQERTLAADDVLLAVGWPGNADELGLEAAGVRTERGYVVVDDTLRTSAPGIWAAGDVTGRMMLVQSATSEARLAVDNALLGGDRQHRHRIVPHGGFTDPEYGSVGLTEAAARAGGQVTVAKVGYANLDRALIDGRGEGFCKLVVDDASQCVVGAHVVGEQAVEVVQAIAAGMASGMKVQHLAELELAYPTFTAIVGLAARRVARDLGVVPVSPFWRALEGAGLDEWERHTTG